MFGRMNKDRVIGAATAWTILLALSLRAEAQTPSCHWQKLSSVPVTSSTGRAIFVAGMDVAKVKEGFVIAGHPVFPWPIADTTVQDSLFGVTANASGVSTLIPAPHPGRRPVFPRILAIPGGVEAIWAERAPTDQDFLAEVVPHGTLWYGRWIDGRWRDVSQIQALTDAHLAPHSGSRLRRESGLLVFDYSIARPEWGPGPWAGIVRLSQRGARWFPDTIPLSPAMRYARIAARGKDSLAVISRVDTGVGFHESAMRARRIRAGGPDWQLGSSGRQVVTHPAAHALADGRWVLAWRLFDGQIFARYATSSGDSLALEPPRALGGASAFTTFPHGGASVVLAWIQDDQLQSVLVTPEHMRSLPPLAIESAIIVPTIVPISATDYHMITSRLGSGRADDIAVSYLTHLRLAC